MMFLVASPWFFVSCAIMFTVNKALQNDSQEITFVYHERIVVEHVLSNDLFLKDSCANRCSATRLSLLDCACDDSCLFFGDCCKDYLYYCSDDSETSNKSLAASISHQLHLSLTDTTKPRWSCITNSDSTQPSLEGILAVASCPPSWSFDDIRRKCEIPGAVREELVYDDKGYVYTNQFCAICNMDVIDNNTTASNSTFSLCASSSESTINCSFEFLVEDVSEISVELRPCSLRLIDSCPRGSSEKLIFGCSAYIDVIIAGANMYKNRMCLNCDRSIIEISIDWQVDEVDLECSTSMIDAPPSFEIFCFPIPETNVFKETLKCIENEYYDEVTKKCQRCDNGTIVSESEYMSILNNSVGLFDFTLLDDLDLTSSNELGPTEGSGSGNHQYDGINKEDNRGSVDDEKSVCITSCRSKTFGPDNQVDDGSSDEGWVTLTTNDSKLSCRVLQNVLDNVLIPNSD
ncbi:uncharacterized protein LOC117108781 [Anneissia japonica]|uniref:uncharacterized protein LOC117108781 n=1 Tax=Anneissia japonica TaxID=1529436 RepID=UPI0014255396|nr:uncharacterized protein LOC117108781 [Anneissia japonica]